MSESLQSLRRRKRMSVAAMLLAVHDRGELVEPESWTWAMLDAVPLWCLMDATTRRRLQCLAGALLMAPALGRWIDPRCLDRARELIGDAAFEEILGAESPIDGPDVAPPAPTSASGVEPLLLDAGATVLLATLHERFRVAALGVDIGEPLGPLPMPIAETLLREAERLLASVERAPEALAS